MPAPRDQTAWRFFEEISDLASSSILDALKLLPRSDQARIRQLAARALRDVRLRNQKTDERLRNGAVRLIVALLPETFPLLEKLLEDCSSPLWYEVHFTLFAALNRADLSVEDQKRVLHLIKDYLIEIQSAAGYAAWKAGDLLGDEWLDPETVGILEELLFSAKHVAGRKAVIHGIEHALRKMTLPGRNRILALVERAAVEDDSEVIRRRAQSILEGRLCGASGPVR